MSCRDRPPVVVFAPNWSQGNPYLDRLGSSLQGLGVSIVLKDYPSRWLVLNALKSAVPDATVIHIHWLHTLIAPILWTGSGWRRRARLLLLWLDLMLLRLRGTRLVWTVHNLVEHESSNRQVEIQIRRLIARGCHRMIVHSDSAGDAVQRCYGLRLAHKTLVARHGNYDGAYPLAAERVQELGRMHHLDETHTTILFFGSIRRYKGVDQLIDAFRHTTNPRLRLLVAGRPFMPEIEAKLRQLAAGEPRIVLEFGFIDQNDVAAWFALADAVVVPFEQTLSSGSAVLAMTLGKALILPTHASVLDLADEKGAIYFKSASELTECLQALEKNRLRAMGQHNRRSADALTWPAAASTTLQAYGMQRHG